MLVVVIRMMRPDLLDAMGVALKDARSPETGEVTTTWEPKR